MKKFIGIILIFSLTVLPAFADYKITQKRTMQGMGQETTVYSKGVRERRESKMVMEGDAETMAMMAQMMPNVVHISQCDLKQDVSLSDAKKLYFVDPYDWTSLTPEQKIRRPAEKVTIKGTMTVSSIVTDSGKRQQMFGMTAKWLKHVQSMEASADSCEGRSNMRMETEGWYVDLVLQQDRCQAPRVEGPTYTGGCRPKMIIKGMQDPGFLLTGTMKMYMDDKLQTTSSVETTALSKATLDQALFEIPKGYTEAASMDALTKMDMSPMASMGSSSNPSKTAGLPAAVSMGNIPDKKMIAIDFLTGNASKVDQPSIRNYVASKVYDAGMTGTLVNSTSAVASGNFANFIALEVKKVKESSGAKIGGLFGKVTGADDAAKLGDTEAEITITVYGKDGKSVVASDSASVKVKGKSEDAVKAAIDKIIGGLLEKIR
ncbi:MAG TPA: hypothetical protein PLP21_07350 [Pyrinomonadaceae bacterium]|nr:hypothetical protein [Acidobacteriota bacterium]HQZ96120.1 hypothetical protein [Pyrinomonadaceae bacterium]